MSGGVDAATAGYLRGRQDAAAAVEVAMWNESNRLAAPGRRGVEQGIGVALAMPAVVRAARGKG
jgi:hypothetical protein